MPMSYRSFGRQPESDRFLTALLRSLLAGYRVAVSPWLGSNCRFEPSCSRYADEALSRFGAIRGTWMAFRRVLRCHPWNPGGYDPVVPERPSPRG